MTVVDDIRALFLEEAQHIERLAEIRKTLDEARFMLMQRDSQPALPAPAGGLQPTAPPVHDRRQKVTDDEIVGLIVKEGGPMSVRRMAQMLNVTDITVRSRVSTLVAMDRLEYIGGGPLRRVRLKVSEAVVESGPTSWHANATIPK